MSVHVEFLVPAVGFLLVIICMGWVVVDLSMSFRRQGLNFLGMKRRRKRRRPPR